MITLVSSVGSTSPNHQVGIDLKSLTSEGSCSSDTPGVTGVRDSAAAYLLGTVARFWRLPLSTCMRAELATTRCAVMATDIAGMGAKQRKPSCHDVQQIGRAHV